MSLEMKEMASRIAERQRREETPVKDQIVKILGQRISAEDFLNGKGGVWELIS